MTTLNAEYWNNRYQNNNTPWDANRITTPLKTYIDQLTDKTLKILVPGAGNAHEAAYLYDNGFNNVWVCDWAEQAIEQFKVNHPDFPKDQLICGDFFEIQETFDLMIEQTFFCAMSPSLRPQYAQKVAQLLKPKGKLVGLLFDVIFSKEEPPFGGTKAEYEAYFKSYFSTIVFEKSYNSIAPRAGKELFMILQKE